MILRVISIIGVILLSILLAFILGNYSNNTMKLLSNQDNAIYDFCYSKQAKFHKDRPSRNAKLSEKKGKIPGKIWCEKEGKILEYNVLTIFNKNTGSVRIEEIENVEEY